MAPDNKKKETEAANGPTDLKESAKAKLEALANLPRRKRILLICIAAVVAAALAGVATGLYLNNKSANKQVAVPAAAETPVGRSVFCIGVGLASVQCEDLDSKELRKYTLPDSLGDVTQFMASKDGKKFLAIAWKTDDDGKSTEDTTVYDETLKAIVVLPTTQGTDYGTLEIRDISWLDNDLVFYTQTSGSKKTLSSFDPSTSKETKLMEVDATLERFMPSGNKRYVYAIQGLTDTASNSVYRKLVVLDTQTKKITEVVNNAIDVNQHELCYSPADNLFYANISPQADQKSSIRTFKVESLSSLPRLESKQQIDNAWYIGPYAYWPVITSAGVLAGPTMGLAPTAPITFYANTNTRTESAVAVDGRGTIMISLPGFPAFDRADSDDVTTRDFFQPPDGTPEKIVAFLDALVEDKTECRAGEYQTIRLYARDGESQFAAQQGGCESDGLYFYKLQSGTYTLVTSTQEGLSCEERDRLGISKVVFPDCRKPGEGL